MNMNPMMPAASAAYAKHMFDSKVRAGIFQPVARHLREDLVEDRLAEGVGMAFAQYVENAGQGRLLDDALLVHIAYLRAIDLGRRVAGAQGARSRSDVFDERNYKDGRVDLLRLDGLLDDGDEEQGLFDWSLATGSDVAWRLASAIDLERWVSSLDEGDRRMLALRQAGHTLAEISLVTGRSMSFVCARLRELGEELAARMGIKLRFRGAA
jgi:hypothetical protein